MSMFGNDGRIQCIDDLLDFLFGEHGNTCRSEFINEALLCNTDEGPIVWAAEKKDKACIFYLDIAKFSVALSRSPTSKECKSMNSKDLLRILTPNNWSTLRVNMKSYLQKKLPSCWYADETIKWGEIVSKLLENNTIVLSGRPIRTGVNEALELIKESLKQKQDDGCALVDIATSLVVFLSLYFLTFNAESTKHRTVRTNALGPFCDVKQTVIDENRKAFVALLVCFLGLHTVEQFADTKRVKDERDGDSFGVYYDAYAQKKNNPEVEKIKKSFKYTLDNGGVNDKLFPCFVNSQKHQASSWERLRSSLTGDKLIATEISTVEGEFKNSKSKVMIISGSGGSGKTTWAKQIALSDRLYDQAIIPVYFPVTHLNQRQLEKEEDWLVDEIQEYWTKLNKNNAILNILFAKIKENQINSWILLDGVNEAKGDVYNRVIKELKFLSNSEKRYTRMRIVILSRSYNDILKSLRNKDIPVQELAITDDQKEAFLREKGWESERINACKRKTALWSLLNPFYLSLIASAKKDDKVNSVESLLYLSYHDMYNNKRPETLVDGFPEDQSALLLNFLFPFVSNKMLVEQQLRISAGELCSHLRTILNAARENAILRDFLCSEENEKQAIMEFDGEPAPYINRLIKQGLIVCEPSNMYSVHQIRRDYFAAYWQLTVQKAVYHYCPTVSTVNKTVLDVLSVHWALSAEITHYVRFLWETTDFKLEYAKLEQTATMCERNKQFGLALQKWRMLLFAYHNGMTDEIAHENDKADRENEKLYSLRKKAYECVEHIHLCKCELGHNFESEQDYFEACELSRFQREGLPKNEKSESSHSLNYDRIPDVNNSLKIVLDIYEYALQNANTLRFTWNYRSILNQIAKGFLLEAQYRFNGTEHSEIQDQTVRWLISLLSRQENQLLFSYIDSDVFTTVLGQITGCLMDLTQNQVSLQDDTKLLETGNSLLRFSIIAGNPDSMNLFAFRKELEETNNDDTRLVNLTIAFICYYSAAGIQHPRVQTYGAKKACEILLEEALCIPKALEDLLKEKKHTPLDCVDWANGSLIENYRLVRNDHYDTVEKNSYTYQIIKELISFLEAAHDEYADYLLGLLYSKSGEGDRGDAISHMRQYYEAKKVTNKHNFSLAMEMLITLRKQTTLRTTQKDPQNEQTFFANGKTLLEEMLKAYLEARNRKSIDRWQPNRHYLERLIRRLEFLANFASTTRNLAVENQDSMVSEHTIIQDMIDQIKETIVTPTQAATHKQDVGQVKGYKPTGEQHLRSRSR